VQRGSYWHGKLSLLSRLEDRNGIVDKAGKLLQACPADDEERLENDTPSLRPDFGRIDPGTLDPLLQVAREIRPDVVAISGDLTQRARRGQFRQAREFLQRLPGALIVVPGNDDVPLYDVFARFGFPLANYRPYISGDLEPFYADADTPRSPPRESTRRTRGRSRCPREPCS
jgi:hypothetical protein